MPHIEFAHEKRRPTSRNAARSATSEAVEAAVELDKLEAQSHLAQQPILPHTPTALHAVNVPKRILDPPIKAPPPEAFDPSFNEDADVELGSKLASIRSLFDKAHATRTSSGTGPTSVLSDVVSAKRASQTA